ncbi:MAG: hypothetical protein HFI07_15075 [Lachnospiraceae bacterium]|nr:hypothetical protein [Lachnospiraceae bacterium]
MENNNALIKKLNQKIEYYLEREEYNRADQACRELVRMQGLMPADHMPEDFPEKLRRKEHETMHITKTSKRFSGIAAAAAAAVLLVGGTVSAAAVYNGSIHFTTKGFVAGEDIQMSYIPEDGEAINARLPEMTGENIVTPISEEEGSTATPWISRKVWDETDEIWDSDDAVSWTKGYQTTRVTEYKYADYFTAAEQAGFEKLFQKNYTGDVFYYENEHLPDETDKAAGIGSETDYSITGEFLCGSGSFTIDQQKYRKTETGESAETASMVITTTGEAGNEREYLNAAGISFKLSDDTETGRMRTTTMFTADSYDVVLQFTGMAEEEIQEVLDAIAP